LSYLVVLNIERIRIETQDRMLIQQIVNGTITVLEFTVRYLFLDKLFSDRISHITYIS